MVRTGQSSFSNSRPLVQTRGLQRQAPPVGGMHVAEGVSTNAFQGAPAAKHPLDAHLHLKKCLQICVSMYSVSRCKP